MMSFFSHWTGKLFKTKKALQGWATVKSSVRRCQRMEKSNFRVKMVTFLLHRWWLAKAFQEQTVVFHCVNVCVDWPFFALPPAITGDHPPETLKVYHRVRKCKFSKCRSAYYPNATATRRILLLSGDIEVNPGWESGLKTFDHTHISNNQRSLSSTPPVNSNIPLHISERRYSTYLCRNQHQSPTVTNQACTFQ